MGYALSFGFGPGPTWKTLRPSESTHPALTLSMNLLRLYLALILLLFFLSPFSLPVFYRMTR